MKNKPYVISVSGISGGGKTTITQNLHQTLSNSFVIEFDEYDDMLHKDFFDWSDRGADYNEWDLTPIINDLQQALGKNYDYIILDYPFGRGNYLMSQYIDFTVFVDTPLDIAMARRIIRDYTNSASEENKINDLFGNLSNTLKSYLNHDRNMYTQHIDTVKDYCDIVVDGTKVSNEITDEIVTYIERKLLVNSYLGKTVTIKIDRPIGSVHPKHADIIYSINYGYIPDVLGGDGEELDVYLLGVSEAVGEYSCKIIGIIHRENDVEDKLVACPLNMNFSEDVIKELTNFQEKYYRTKIEVLP